MVDMPKSSTKPNNTVARWLKKFSSGTKNLGDRAMSGWLKTVDSEAVFKTIEANPVSSTGRVSGEFGILLNQ